MKLSELSTGTLIMFIIAAVLVILLIVLIVVTVKVLKKPSDNENYKKKEYTSPKTDIKASLQDKEDDEEDEDAKNEKFAFDHEAYKPKNNDDHEDASDDPDEDDDSDYDEDEDGKTEVLKSTLEADEAEAQEKYKEVVAERFASLDTSDIIAKANAISEDVHNENKEFENPKKNASAKDELDSIFGNTDNLKNKVSQYAAEDEEVGEDEETAGYEGSEYDSEVDGSTKNIGPVEVTGEETEEEDKTPRVDSAFSDNASFTLEKDNVMDSAFTDSAFVEQPSFEKYETKNLGMTPYKDEGTITVNPVNKVNINTVNSDNFVDTVNVSAGISSADDMKDFLKENPVPKKKKKKTKKGEAIFEQKFREEDSRAEIKGGDYFWYNNQDIENLTKKEDMYYYCKYFDHPEKAILPLIIEMYDCAFVKTEEIEEIAYGIKFKAMGMREILNAKENISFDRAAATKEPTEADKKKIYDKWCEYVDNFLNIIVINAPERVKEEIKLHLYSYGHNDAEVLMFCPDEPDGDDDF